jgi:hypothetical protein
MEDLAKHLASDCTVARRRRALARKSKEREREKARQLVELLEARRRKPETVEVVDMAQPETGSPKPRKFKGFTEADLRRLENYRASSPTDIDSRETCELCKLPLRGSKTRHEMTECSFRTINCPNRSFGCTAIFPLNKTSLHLREDCLYEQRRMNLAERSRAREEFVLCPGCDKEVQIRLQDKHDSEECTNRKVSCRNAFLGCKTLVRISERAQHEEVDKMAQTKRPCLFFGGGGSDLGIEEGRAYCNGGAHIHLGESDITPPWTVEYWVYR